MSTTAKTPLVLFHANCFDGFTSAWVYKTLMGGAEFVPCTYGDPPPDTAGRMVWIIDFSYKRETMKKLIVASRWTKVLDHHKTAQADLEGILDEIRREHNINRPKGSLADEIIFDMNRSGATLAWDVCTSLNDAKRGFRKPHNRPWLVNYVEDRDLWKHALPGSEEVSALVAATDQTFEAWDKLSAMTLAEATEKGRAIVQYIGTYGKKARAESRLEIIGGFQVPTMNLPYMNCSEHLNGLLDENKDASFVASYFKRKDGRWQFSLRSREDFDVSKVALAFGGGGHKRAAGFDSEQLPWEGAQALVESA